MFKRPLALLLGLLVLAAAGCAGSTGQFSFWPFGQKKNAGGVLSPTEQIEILRDLAKKAHSRTEQQKQEIAAQLVPMLGKEGDPLIRAEVVRTMRNYPTPDTLAAVRGALKDPEADVRIAACDALGRIGGPESIASLSEAVRGDVDPDVRMAAARGLGQTRDPASVAALGTALEDSDPSMQYLAVNSLKNVTGKDLGDDVRRWQQYVKGEVPGPAPSVSIAQRLRQMFW